MNVPFSSATLVQTLPIGRGDRVLVIGEAPELERSVTRRGAHAVGRRTLARAAAPVDHAIVLPAGSHGNPERVLAGIVRVLRPGGCLVLAVSRRRLPATAKGWTVAGGRRALEEGGFTGVEAYGIRLGAFSPRFLVPLDAPAALHWFVTSICLPASLRELLLVAAFSRASSHRVALGLFPELGFLARRVSGGAAC